MRIQTLDILLCTLKATGHLRPRIDAKYIYPAGWTGSHVDVGTCLDAIPNSCPCRFLVALHPYTRPRKSIALLLTLFIAGVTCNILLRRSYAVFAAAAPFAHLSRDWRDKQEDLTGILPDTTGMFCKSSDKRPEACFHNPMGVHQ